MQLMSIGDLAAYLGDSKRTIYKYIASGDCPPYVRISAKNIKFDRTDVDVWLESKKIYPKPGGKRMSKIQMVDNVKNLLKSVIRDAKLPWTPGAKAVLKSAEKHACKNGSELIGTEHILCGIVSVKECLGAAILKNLSVDTDKFVAKCEKLSKKPGRNSVGKAKLSEDIKSVVQSAYEQANNWGHEYIGAEHLLAGILLAEKGIGFQILKDMGVTLDKVREETSKLIVCSANSAE